MVSRETVSTSAADRAVGEGQRPDHRVRQMRLALERAEGAHQGLGDPLAGVVAGRRASCAACSCMCCQLVLHGGDQQMDLGREVAVERAERHPRGLRDLAHLHRVEAAPAGQLGAGVQDPAAARLLPLGQRQGGGCAVCDSVAAWPSCCHRRVGDWVPFRDSRCRDRDSSGRGGDRPVVVSTVSMAVRVVRPPWRESPVRRSQSAYLPVDSEPSERSSLKLVLD